MWKEKIEYLSLSLTVCSANMKCDDFSCLVFFFYGSKWTPNDSRFHNIVQTLAIMTRNERNSKLSIGCFSNGEICRNVTADGGFDQFIVLFHFVTHWLSPLGQSCLSWTFSKCFWQFVLLTNQLKTIFKLLIIGMSWEHVLSWIISNWPYSGSVCLSFLFYTHFLIYLVLVFYINFCSFDGVNFYCVFLLFYLHESVCGSADIW